MFFLFRPIDERILVVSTSGNDQNDYENENLFKLKEDQFISVFLLCKSPKLHILGVTVVFCYEMKRYAQSDFKSSYYWSWLQFPSNLVMFTRINLEAFLYDRFLFIRHDSMVTSFGEACLPRIWSFTQPNLGTFPKMTVQSPPKMIVPRSKISHLIITIVTRTKSLMKRTFRLIRLSKLSCKFVVL